MRDEGHFYEFPFCRFILGSKGRSLYPESYLLIFYNMILYNVTYYMIPRIIEHYMMLHQRSLHPTLHSRSLWYVEHKSNHETLHHRSLNDTLHHSHMLLMYHHQEKRQHGLRLQQEIKNCKKCNFRWKSIYFGGSRELSITFLNSNIYFLTPS